MIRGEKIKYFREKNKLTQKELTSGICSVPYLSKVENNSIVPSREILILLCKRLNIEYDELLQSSSSNGIKKMIFNWYEDIKARNRPASADHYATIEKKIKGITDIELLTMFHLAATRHFLLIREFNKAEEQLAFAEKYMTYMPKEIEGYYFYFSGLNEYLNGHFQKALELYLKASEYVNEPEYHYQLALIYSRLGKITLSIFHSERAMEEFNKNILFFKVVDCYILLGINYNRINEHATALSYFKKALKGIESLPDIGHLKIHIYHNIGIVYHKQKKPWEAIDYFLKSLNVRKDLQGGELTIYLLASNLFQLNEIEDATRWIEKGLVLLKGELNETYCLLKILQFQVQKRRNEEDYKIFLEETALPIFKQKDEFMYIRMCYEQLGDYYYRKKQYKRSSECYCEANSVESSFI
ncbi:tetratricopeptide repeat protein [Fictibacillus sp. KIGAM418]|uniref:Tetratricopeptide repeat protein n=1 Tax=Fictibacillus marinisediminis TaxID=2878389 RepID=A0A9X1XDF6_9BACL|nr:tetratricopeptide repeat protein [Fictibacillus marinisediminis]MCK6258664.1 tetratricopeptide repeat protein [Fictibacillus marinisediminis]